MAKALYRKYRPTSLSDVVGQEQITKTLESSIKQGKISHAYLLIGPRGTGKTSVARIFAHEINKFKYEIEDNYVDIIEIDGASNRGIDNIRELREKAMVAPTSGKYKVYIIDEVHMLTKEAFNALLKTLEEPPKHVVFIMATTDAYKVPVTITSRSQTFTFKLVDENLMVDFLKEICKKESIKIDDEALLLIAKRGGGSFRDSLSLLDQISTLSKDRISKDLVISAIGLPKDEQIKGLLDAYQSGNQTKIIKLLKDFLASGIKSETLAEELIGQIIDSPDPRLLSLLSRLPDVKAPFSEAKLMVALLENVPTPTDTPVKQNVDFSWEKFLTQVKDENEVVYSQLEKSDYEYKDGYLNIYPSSKVCQTILNAKNNLEIIHKFTKNIEVKIKQAGEKLNLKKEDKLLEKISGIMGGEVRNDGGKDPFGK